MDLSRLKELKPQASAINAVFATFIIAAILTAAFNGQMQAVTEASFESAKSAVQLAIGLIGIMALWLGLMRILEAGGLLHSLARALRPLMRRLFPDVPAEHPAMSAMILNIAANMLGLGNAATPFGIKAMHELNRLNPLKGTATNAMCLFLALNTSSVALLPLGVIGVRAAAGATEPAAIFIPTLLATMASTAVAITLALLLARRDQAYHSEVAAAKCQPAAENSAVDATAPAEQDFSHLRMAAPGFWGRWVPVIVIVLLLWALGRRVLAAPDLTLFISREFFVHWLMPLLMLTILLYGMGRGVKVYEAVTEGAKQGFEIAIRIIPFLVAILVAIGMLRASGALAAAAQLLEPLTGLIYMPAEVLPMALIRPLSGSGAFGVMSALVAQAPDSYEAFVASIMMGSTETTFYVLAVYFGAVGIVKIRHALAAALCADIAGIICACLCARFFWEG